MPDDDTGLDGGDQLDTTAAAIDADAAADTTTSTPAQPEVDYAAMFGRPEFQQALTGAIEQTLGQYAPQPPPYQPEPVQFDQLDPISDPEGYANALMMAQAQVIRQALDERLGPYEPALQHTAEETWKQDTERYYGELEQQIGPFDHDLARQFAAGIHYLSDGRTQDAHREAAAALAAHDKQVAERAVDEFKRSLGSRDSTPYEPGVGVSGVPGEGKPRDEIEAARMWHARQGAAAI